MPRLFRKYTLGQAVELPAQITVEPPPFLTLPELQSYIYAYNSLADAEDDSDTQFRQDNPTEDVLQRNANDQWAATCDKLRRREIDNETIGNRGPRIFDPRLSDDDILRTIFAMTTGKPLMVDWFCQIVFGAQATVEMRDALQRVATLPSDEQANAFKRDTLHHLLAKPNAMTAETANEQEAIRFAYIARKGLDSATYDFLYRREHPTRTPLAATAIKERLTALIDNTFIKVRTVSDPTREQVVYLHDEFYDGLAVPAEEIIGQDSIITMAKVLVEAYDASMGPPFTSITRSLAVTRAQTEEVRQPILGLTDEIDSPPTSSEVLWYEDKDKITTYFVLERQTHDLLIERLYYQLRTDFFSGYDVYARHDTIAIAEYQASYDTRLHKEYLRYEAWYLRWVRAANRAASLEAAGRLLAFMMYREIECELRAVKRLWRDSEEYGVASSVSSSASVNVHRTNITNSFTRIANKPNVRTGRTIAGYTDDGILERTLTRLSLVMGWSSDRCDALRRTFAHYIDDPQRRFSPRPKRGQPLADHIRYALARIAMCRADALVTAAEIAAPDDDTLAFLVPAAETLAALEQTLDPNREYTTFDEVYDYLIWHIYLVFGRLYRRRGDHYGYNHNAPKAIDEYKLSIEYIKNAGKNVEGYLDASRNALALAYDANGQQNQAIETADVALSSKARYGHKTQIALGKNTEASILLHAPYPPEQVYLEARDAIKLLDDMREDEKQKLDVYHQIVLTLARSARRLGRSMRSAQNRVTVLRLHESMLVLLTAAVNFFRGNYDSRLELEAMNELGCNYRSMGRVWQESGDVDKGRYYYSRALIVFDQIVARYENPKDPFHRHTLEYIDTLQDMAQTIMYQRAGRLDVVARVSEAFARADAKLATLRTNNDTMHEMEEWLLRGKSLMRQAEWTYMLYDEDAGSGSTTRAMGATAKSLFIRFILIEIAALQCFANVRNDILRGATYSRDLNYISRIETRLLRNFGLNELEKRQIARAVLNIFSGAQPILQQVLAASADPLFQYALDTPGMAIPSDFVVDKGVQLVKYILDINREGT